jgi:hypothetical protein
MISMTDVATCLRVAADCLACAALLPSEADAAREYAAMAAAELPADLAAQVERALDCGDHRMGARVLDGLANALKPPAAPTPQPKSRRQRKLSIGRMIAAAERGGKNVTSITTPDGVTLRFGESEPTEASNPWLDDLKVTKQ